MTRRITLPLGSTTTETHCGDCPFFIDTRAMRPRFHKCAIYGKFFVARHHDCRAAKIKDEEVGDAE